MFHTLRAYIIVIQCPKIKYRSDKSYNTMP